MKIKVDFFYLYVLNKKGEDVNLFNYLGLNPLAVASDYEQL